MSTKTNDLFSDLDIDAIVNESLKELKGPVEKKNLGEAYVAQPKTYSQVTEFLSQKSKEAHIAIYKAHVEAMNRVSAELDTAPRDTANSDHSEFRSLKLDEAANVNAVWLHELFFAGCFDAHSEIFMDSLAYIELERSFGTFADAQKELIACCMACGEGWVIVGYNMFLKKFVTTIVTDDSHDVMVGLYPVIVIDMKSHSYFRDYLTDKKSFCIAMMRTLNWNVIEERVKKAQAIAQLLK